MKDGALDAAADNEPVPDGLRHRVLRASAGTGKTYALSSRYLALVAHGADPESILATTFTRKAASEILGRILTRLAAAACDPSQAAQLAGSIDAQRFSQHDCEKLLVRLVASLDRLAVCTIDSFLYRLICCFRLEMGMPRQVELVAGMDPKAVRLRRLAVDAVLADQDLDTVIDLLRRTGQADAQRGVAQLIDNLVVGDLYEVYRQNPDPAPWSKLKTTAAGLSKTDLAGYIEKMGELATHMPDKRWATAHKTATENAHKADWSTFLDKGLAKALLTSDGTFYKQPIPEQIESVYQPLIEHAVARLIHKVAQQTIATHGLLTRFEAHYRRLRREHGVMLYGDLALVLHDWFSAADTPQLDDFYYRLDGRIAHLLLDEFQDTSTLQWRVLQPLAEEIAAYADGTRSLFCVGDVKQAIYGWRGGCPEIFDGLRDHLHLGQDAAGSLDHSYRTSQVVLDAVNQVFHGLADNTALQAVRKTATAWQTRFSTQTAKTQSRPGYTQLLTAPATDLDPPGADTEQTNTTAPAQTHDTFVAEHITRIAHRAPGRSIGVLVATNDQVRQLLLLLGRQKLRVSGEGNNTITDHPAVNTVLSALTLADHPGDTVAVFNATNSPLAPAIGLKPAAPQTQVAHVGARIRRGLALHGYAQTLTGWAKALAPSCDAQGVSRLLQLIVLADQYDPTRTLRPSEFVAFVQSAQVQEQAPAPIRVMTVHKAKGLEFDAVVLPYLDRPMTKSNGVPVDVLRDSPLSEAKAVFRRANQLTRSLHPDLAKAYNQWEARQVSDELSKLYVAMTRPRYALYMVIPPLELTKDGKPKAPGWSAPSHAAILRHALAPDDQDHQGNQELYAAGNPDWPSAAPAVAPDPHDPSADQRSVTLTGVIEAGGQPTRSLRVVTPSKTPSIRRVNVPDLLRLDPAGSQIRGTVIHAWLAMIEWLTPGPDAACPIDPPGLIQEAQRVAPVADEHWIAELISQFQQIITNPVVTEALRRPPQGDGDGHFDLWREREFVVPRQRELLKGVYDRVVVYKHEGKYQRAELIDFKTDRYHHDQKDQLAQRYDAQINTYRAALSQSLKIPKQDIDAQLVFVAPDACHRLRL